MDQHMQEKGGKKETVSIVIVIALVIIGGVFYSIDVYKKAKASRAAQTAPMTPAIGAGN